MVQQNSCASIDVEGKSCNAYKEWTFKFRQFFYFYMCWDTKLERKKEGNREIKHLLKKDQLICCVLLHNFFSFFRCSMTTVNPDTGVKDKDQQPLKELKK